MALKDWKKIRKNVWRKSNSSLNIKKAYTSATTYIWQVNKYKTDSGIIIFTKRFKTKTQALRYAKAYMRKH